MSKQVQLRGGTTSQHNSFTGASREVTVDTDKHTLVVHDGSTAGGFPLAKIASPELTGTPTAPTPSTGDSSTKIATTRFVTNRLTSEVLYCSANRGLGWETIGASSQHGFVGSFTSNVGGFTIASGSGSLSSGSYIRIPKTGLYLVKTKCYFGGSSTQRINTQVRTSINDTSTFGLHFIHTESGSEFLEQSSLNQLTEGNLIFFNTWVANVSMYTAHSHSEIQLAYLGAI
jgi:hypothetical protein